MARGCCISDGISQSPPSIANKDAVGGRLTPITQCHKFIEALLAMAQSSGIAASLAKHKVA